MCVCFSQQCFVIHAAKCVPQVRNTADVHCRSGNSLEFKAMSKPENLFARHVVE